MSRRKTSWELTIDGSSDLSDLPVERPCQHCGHSLLVLPHWLRLVCQRCGGLHAVERREGALVTLRALKRASELQAGSRLRGGTYS